VKIDPSKERLNEALAHLTERNEIIGRLNDDLVELQEQLDSANKDIDFYQHEKKRLMATSSFQGETYESTGQQVRAMQTERIELLKQLDAARGQTGLANESVERIQSLLNSERKANAALRRRQELTALQEDARLALETVEAERQKNTELQHDIRSLQDTILMLKNEIKSVQAAEQAAVEASLMERQKQEVLKDDIRVLEERYRAEVMLSVQAAAERNTAHQPGSKGSHNDPDSSKRRDYFISSAGNAQSNTDNGARSTTPLVSLSELSKSTQNQSASPNPQVKSPRSETGFRTVHGQHRPDGAMGGYRVNRKVQRNDSDDLYSSLLQNGRTGGRTLSTQSSRSDGSSAVSSHKAQSSEDGKQR
jgi:hypothetical protein